MEQDISLNIFIISLYVDRFYMALLADMGMYHDIKKTMNERTLAKNFGKWIYSLSEAVGEN